MDDQTIVYPGRHKLDVDDYHRLGDAGILNEDSRVELIDGELIDMAPIGQEHSGTVNRLTETLVLACRGRAIVSVQNPVRLDRRNEPQPDFAILKRRADFYTSGDHAGPADLLLLIEVADSSLQYDRSVKLSLYARAGVPEYWIVDLNRGLVTVYKSPFEAGFDDVTTRGKGSLLPLSLHPEIVIDLDHVLG